MWVITLIFATKVYGQEPVMNLDSIPAYIAVKGLVPDCDRPAVAFSFFKNGEWNFREQAGFGYALFMNASGDAVNITTEFALAGVQDAQSNPLLKGLHGYIAGLSQNKDGNWCVSVNENLTTFDGRFWFRINSEWAMYLRDGCQNPVLVYDPVKELTPKPGFELAIIPPGKCDTIIVICKTECPPPVVIQPCDNCCPADSLEYEMEFFAVADFERVGSELEKGIGGGVEWIQYYLHRNDKDQQYYRKPNSLYGGLTVYMAKKGIEFKPTCDTCGYWGDIPGGLAFRSDVYFGTQHQIFKKLGVFGFAELRYVWINTENKRNKFLSDEGIKLRGGLKIKLQTPSKMPIFRSIQVELGPQVSTYATPDKSLAVSAGGFLELRANIGARDKEVRQAEHAKRMKRAQAQFTRDSISRDEKILRDSVRREERLMQDSVKVDSFLSQNPQPIVIDSVRLAVDTTVHAPRLPWVKAPLPFTKGAKGVKLNDSKTEVFSLQNENNRLLAELKQDQSVWGEFQKNQKKLNRAERKLARREN